MSPGESLLDGWEKMCPGIGTMVNPGRPYVTPSGLLDGMGSGSVLCCSLDHKCAVWLGVMCVHTLHLLDYSTPDYNSSPLTTN